MNKINLFWFRRDLRLEDNHGLYNALNSGLPVLPLFIFDRAILDKLEDPSDPRITFIYDEICRLKREIEETGGSMIMGYGEPEEVIADLTGKYEISAVFANHDYEPYARERDERVRKLLAPRGIYFLTFKDQVIFEKDEVLKNDGTPYTVFTPYSRKWKEELLRTGLAVYPSENLKDFFYRTSPFEMSSLEPIGFKRSNYIFPSRAVDENILSNYHNTRDYPALPGTTRLGVHLRFGTISIRKLAEMASRLNGIYLNELIWREFYMMILWHFPQVAGRAFKPAYDRIDWRNDEKEFHAWCVGETGYPIVDAGMRELNQTGYMHNRLRMITASFLTKHLLIDWRWGEAYFASRLLDFELSSNNGGWQWAAGTGCDAAPYFRVFNPELQAQKFDPDQIYTMRWVPEFKSKNYPKPVVDHKDARNRAIRAYQKAIKQ